MVSLVESDDPPPHPARITERILLESRVLRRDGFMLLLLLVSVYPL
jgi:hypothetical protein